MILVIAEHDGQSLKPATLSVISAAQQLKQAVTVLVAGLNCKNVANACAKITGVGRVLYADAACYAHALAENMAALIAKLAHEFAYVLAPATTFGKNILPRAAALLDVGQVSDVMAIVSADTFIRPIYAGNALATVQSFDPIKLLTIRTTAFAPAVISAQEAPVEICNYVEESGLSAFVKHEINQSARPELTDAKIIVAGGRGLQSAEKFHLIEQLADCLNAAIGASRAAVDAGFAPNDYQIGQTGKIVAPELYIAIGISGAIQHIAGIKDSKIIVAINKDPDAPIFQVADYGIVGDLFEIVPELIKKLKS